MAESDYQPVIVQAYENCGGECSREPLRLRIYDQQPGFTLPLRVSCARPDRKKHAAGDLFLLECRPVSPPGKDQYLYTPPQWGLRPIEPEEAKRFLSGKPVTVEGKRFVLPSTPS
jgi:hypothetical protein